MMGEEHGKDEISAQNMLKNHDALEQTVNDYADTIRTLGESARGLINEGHAEGWLLIVSLITFLHDVFLSILF